MKDAPLDQRPHWDALAHLDPDAAVIDPRDRRGDKNAYLAAIRNETIAQSLAARGVRTALDLGCGTGSLGRTLLGLGARVVGLDIARGLLARVAERGLGDAYLPVLYDGWRFPIRDASLDAVTTYVVMTHIVEDRQLIQVLGECARVLAPGGVLIAIEQVRRKVRDQPSAFKRFRTLASYEQLFAEAGLRPRRAEILRYGHTPWIYLIRFGWIPKRLHGRLARLERWWGSRIGVPPWDYCDVLFEAVKP